MKTLEIIEKYNRIKTEISGCDNLIKFYLTKKEVLESELLNFKDQEFIESYGENQ